MAADKYYYPGLLASLWQFPQTALTESHNSAAHRKSLAQKFVAQLGDTVPHLASVQHVAELGSLVHIFSHLKLTMHVHRFNFELDADAGPDDAFLGSTNRKWVGTEAMDSETLSTGMRKCWDLRDNIS
jgi:A/G-specific adenine glycosylase